MQMRTRPSRVINENSNVMGLQIVDLFALGCLYWMIQAALFPFALELLAIPVIAIIAGWLIRVRLKYRRRIVRDTLKHYLIAIFSEGVYFDGK